MVLFLTGVTLHFITCKISNNHICHNEYEMSGHDVTSMVETLTDLTTFTGVPGLITTVKKYTRTSISCWSL